MDKCDFCGKVFPEDQLDEYIDRKGEVYLICEDCKTANYTNLYDKEDY